MANADPVRQERFQCSLFSATEGIAKGIYASRATYTYTHWNTLSAFCVNVGPDPLSILYRDLIPILTTFATEYRRGEISSSGKNFCSCTVYYTVCSIRQDIYAMGSKYPRLNSEGVMGIYLKFQYRAYSNHDPPPPQRL